jgi:rhamnogalacturonan endolyase
VVRTLYRLDPEFFPNGRTNIKDAPLPLLSDILASTKVQDETWQLANGSYITKYDNSRFVFSDDFYGVYGPRRGAWIIRPGRDYLNGDSLKQELSVHRESQTGDAVLLNILHGTHFETAFENTIPEGKVFGPWLVYINNGSVADAAQKAKEEDGRWPYTWFNGTGFHSRGTLRGTLVLDDGKPAAGAAVFLGDDGKTISQGTTWVYNVNASADGSFEIRNVRTEKQYTLQAWSNGGKIGAVTTVFERSNITLSAGTIIDLGKLVWKTQGRNALWRLGDFDRKALGFQYGGAPYTHGLVDNCPANFTYTVGVTKEKEWCFGKSAAGTWSVVFDAPKGVQENDTVLTVSLAGCSGKCSRIGGEGATLEVWVNGENLGDHLTPLGGNDPSLYRSATEAGEWRYFEWNLTKGIVVEGRNTVEFVTPAAVVKRWKGVMWDAIMLEVA